MLRKYQHAPHPFVLEPPVESKERYEEGESMQFSIVLLGRGTSYYSYYVNSFVLLQRIGIGIGQRVPFYLESVMMNGKPIYENLEFHVENYSSLAFVPEEKHVRRIRIEFKTPVKIVKEGGVALNISFRDFLKALLWRYTLINAWHSDEGDVVSYKVLINKAADINTISRSLKKVEIRRYSTRQKHTISMWGLTGDIVFDGPLEKFYNLLKLGEIIHLGHNTSFGFGKYAVHVIE